MDVRTKEEMGFVLCRIDKPNELFWREVGTEMGAVEDSDDEEEEKDFKFQAPFRMHKCEVSIEEFAPIKDLVLKDAGGSSREIGDCEGGAVLFYEFITRGARKRFFGAEDKAWGFAVPAKSSIHNLDIKAGWNPSAPMGSPPNRANPSPLLTPAATAITTTIGIDVDTKPGAREILKKISKLMDEKQMQIPFNANRKNAFGDEKARHVSIGYKSSTQSAKEVETKILEWKKLVDLVHEFFKIVAPDVVYTGRNRLLVKFYCDGG